MTQIPQTYIGHLIKKKCMFCLFCFSKWTHSMWASTPPHRPRVSHNSVRRQSFVFSYVQDQLSSCVSRCSEYTSARGSGRGSELLGGARHCSVLLGAARSLSGRRFKQPSLADGDRASRPSQECDSSPLGRVRLFCFCFIYFFESFIRVDVRQRSPRGFNQSCDYFRPSSCQRR